MQGDSTACPYSFVEETEPSKGDFLRLVTFLSSLFKECALATDL